MKLRAWWLCAAVLLACFTAGCGAGQDSRAAEAFRTYFASIGSHALKGLTVTKVSAKTHNGVRTL